MSRYFWLIFGSLDHRTWQDFAGKCRTLKTQKARRPATKALISGHFLVLPRQDSNLTKL
nr:MAG TPA: hypothetical protein [Caudoviricetes sp.]